MMKKQDEYLMPPARVQFLIIMSSLNDDDSESLVIAQGRNEIQINSSNQNGQKEDDLFQLSRDDPTLSFQIEQQKKQQMIIAICEPSQSSQLQSNLQNQEKQENKKKRKDIFEKFRKPQSSIANKLDKINSEDNLLNIFDSIFKTKCSQPQQNLERQSKIDNNFLRPQTEIMVRQKTPSSQKRERLKIFGKKRYTKEFQGILPSQLLQSQISVAPVESRLVGSPIIAKKTSDSINFSVIQNRLSQIMGDQNMDVSKEELQIKNILQSQIFKDQQQIAVKNQTKHIMAQTQSKVITSMERIQIQRQVAISHNIDVSPDKKQLMLSALLPVVQKNQPVIDQSRVLRSDNSILSNSPLLNIQGYECNQGFRPQNSMANINSHNIDDLTMKTKDNNVDNVIQKKSANILQNKLYQSQIIESYSPLTIIKVNIFQHEKRMPEFLRQIRKHISIYPNFYLQNNPNTIQCIRDQFSILFGHFTEAINILSEFCQTVLDLKSKKLLYLGQLSKTLTVQFFLESGWQKFMKIQNFDLIKPMEPFESRQWSYQKARTALKNYQNIIEYYKNKGIRLDINEDKGKKKYFEIRQKFWDICGNMKLISQDIYSQMIDCQFPQHFYIFLEFMRSQFPSKMNDSQIKKLQQLKRLFKILKNQNDLLINSEIGVKIKNKLSLMQKYLIVY